MEKISQFLSEQWSSMLWGNWKCWKCLYLLPYHYSYHVTIITEGPNFCKIFYWSQDHCGILYLNVINRNQKVAIQRALRTNVLISNECFIFDIMYNLYIVHRFVIIQCKCWCILEVYVIPSYLTSPQLCSVISILECFDVLL